jgi:uncharacterized protein YciW
VRSDALVAHYLCYLAHSAEPDVAALAQVDGRCGDERRDAMARHADMLTRTPRNATRDDIAVLMAPGSARRISCGCLSSPPS